MMPHMNFMNKKYFWHLFVCKRLVLSWDQKLQKFLVSPGWKPLAECKAARQVLRLELVPADSLVGVILQIPFQPPPSWLVNVQCINPAGAHWGEVWISNWFGSIPIHHCFDSLLVLISPCCSPSPRVGITRAVGWIAIEHCAFLHLLFANGPNCLWSRWPCPWELSLEVMDQAWQKVHASPPLEILKQEEIPLLLRELRSHAHWWWPVWSKVLWASDDLQKGAVRLKLWGTGLLLPNIEEPWFWNRKAKINAA